MQKRRKPRHPDRWLAALFLLPSALAVAVFVYGFIAWTGYVSLSNWSGLVPDFSFAGLKNYADLFHDYRFQSDLRNTLFFTLFFLLFTVGLGFILAVLIDQRLRGEGFFRSVFLFPMALSFIVTGVVWQWLFNPSTGINRLLGAVGLSPLPKWYTSTEIIPGIKLGSIAFGLPVALIAVVIAAVWQMTGFAMAMYLAGLRGIPEELKEAARIDGATERQVYTQVILPLLRPITVSIVVIMVHISLKIFDLIYAMTGPGANFVTDMPGVYMFEATFRGNFYARGAAIAILMLLVSSLIIVPYLMHQRKEST
ncbi:MAG: sugar ABC transporter permease [Hydrogenibacillus schlegelii]|uniref:Sugar ABC transporter permease n=1 Tax=Hydrogenibacillus schlegelii TaxID=1484 RepID=A0A947CY28_HYDSH|nr:sugar ABC transporter permease [Hydrogenibacillus schlegelii]